jgi:hypothetical protein
VYTANIQSPILHANKTNAEEQMIVSHNDFVNCVIGLTDSEGFEGE